MADGTPGLDLPQHLDLLGALSIALGVLGIVAAGVGFLFATFATAMFAGAPEGDARVAGALAIFIGAILLVAVVLAILGIVGGLDLRRRRPRGRTLVLVFAVASLFSFPLGTAFGVYALWVLTRPGVETALSPPSGPPRVPA